MLKMILLCISFLFIPAVATAPYGGSEETWSEPDESALFQIRHQVKMPSSCSNAWGSFPADPLSRSLRIARSSHDALHNYSIASHYGGKKFQGIFASRAHRFAYCSIAKVASSAWSNIFQKLYFNDPSARYIPGKPYYSTSEEDIQAVFSDPGATTAVTVREPLSRFASAFLNKCNFTEKGSATFGKSCPVTNTNPSMKEVVEWMLSQDPTNVEFHWLLQSEYCDLKNRLHSYDYVLHYAKESFGADSACLMEKAGIAHFNTYGPEHNWTAYWTTETASCQDTEGLDMANEPYTTSCSQDEEATQLKLLFPPKVAKRLMEHLHQDYETFNIPEPSWLSQATGVLYETPFDKLDFTVGDGVHRKKVKLLNTETSIHSTYLGAEQGKQVFAMSHPFAWSDFANQYFPIMGKVSVANNSDACVEWVKVCLDDGYAETPDGCQLDSDRFQIHVVGAYMREPGDKNLEELEMDFTQAMGDMTEYDPYFEYNVGLFTLDLDHFVTAFDNGNIPYFASTFMGENGTTYYSVLVQMPGSLAPGAKSINNMELIAETSQLLPAKHGLHSYKVPRASQQSLEYAKKYLLNAPRRFTFDGKTPVLAFLHISFATSDVDRDFQYFKTVLRGTTTSLLDGKGFTGMVENSETFAFRYVQTEGVAKTKGPVTVKDWEHYQSDLHSKCFDVANNAGFNRLADNHYGHTVADVVPYVKAQLASSLPQRFYYGPQGAIFYYMYFPNGWGTELIGPCEDSSVCPELHTDVDMYSFCTQGIKGDCSRDKQMGESTIVACRRRRGTVIIEPDSLSDADGCEG